MKKNNEKYLGAWIMDQCAEGASMSVWQLLLLLVAFALVVVVMGWIALQAWNIDPAKSDWMTKTMLIAYGIVALAGVLAFLSFVACLFYKFSNRNWTQTATPVQK